MLCSRCEKYESMNSSNVCINCYILFSNEFANDIKNENENERLRQLDIANEVKKHKEDLYRKMLKRKKMEKKND